MAIPKIEIDNKRCTTPFECKKCLQICPHAVFMVLTTEIFPFRENKPKEYELLPVYSDKCIGCNACIEVCPVDAIKIYL